MSDCNNLLLPQLYTFDWKTTTTKVIAQSLELGSIEIDTSSDVDQCFVRSREGATHLVKVGHPIRGNLKGPFEVTPNVACIDTTLTTKVNQGCKLVLRLWKENPCWHGTVRGDTVQYDTGTPAASSSLAHEFPFYGRKSATIWLTETGTSQAFDYYITGRVYRSGAVHEYAMTTAATIAASGVATVEIYDAPAIDTIGIYTVRGGVGATNSVFYRARD